MERLTIKFGKGTYIKGKEPEDCKHKDSTFCKYNKKCKHIKDRSCKLLKAADLLASYEDTGLTPEEIGKIEAELSEYRQYGTVEEVNQLSYNATL